MKQLISKLMERRAADKPVVAAKKTVKSLPAENQDSSHTIEDNSDNGTRRRLVQMLLRDGLRQHAIPADWVECQMMAINSRSRGPGMYVRLVMRQWDLRLLTYAYAFQTQLLAAITQFEPQAPTWLRGVSWAFDVGNTCPYPDMPDRSMWRAASPRAETPGLSPGPVSVPTNSAAVAATGTDTDTEVMQDLERMFAIRDANIEQQAFADTAPVDFQNTEPLRPL